MALQKLDRRFDSDPRLFFTAILKRLRLFCVLREKGVVAGLCKFFGISVKLRAWRKILQKRFKVICRHM